MEVQQGVFVWSVPVFKACLGTSFVLVPRFASAPEVCLYVLPMQMWGYLRVSSVFLVVFVFCFVLL